MFCVSARWALISLPRVTGGAGCSAWLRGDACPARLVVVEVAAEAYLRLMAQDLAGARPLGPVRVRAASIQALAHAFALLGLISAGGAEAAVIQASRALGLRGGSVAEPAIWLGPACGYWNMRAQGRHALAWIPRAVAAGALRVSVAAADLRCDWFRTARAGLRFQVQGAAAGQQPPSRHADMALAGLSAADDAGRSYRLRWDGGRGSDRLWMGEAVAEPMSEHERPDDVGWFELAAVDGPAARVVFAPPPATQVGSAAPPWPTPAETYLAWLSWQHPAPELGRSGGRQILAAVAEGLVSVGAMPAQSPLLPPILGRHKRSPHPDLPRTWPHPVRMGTPPDLQIALCAALPFDHAAAVIEGLSAWGEDVQLHVYGWPWVQGQHWPAAIPSFTVRAIDDLGQEHEGHPGGWRGYGAGEGHAEFTLWPAVLRHAGRLRVVISTLWEARWADIELPSR
jgi:hypothetical protein